MPGKYVPASVGLSAFNCPHCDVLTTQYWFDLGAMQRSSDARTPYIWTEEELAKVKAEHEHNKDLGPQFWTDVAVLATGVVVLAKQDFYGKQLENLNLSLCYDCKRFSIWRHDQLLWPVAIEVALPNSDLPEDVALDYREAGAILPQSPRGAAALLRLCVQKLCIELGGKGKKLDDDIAFLVSEGLDPVIQRTLDIVRVVGNEAVHPGQIDLRDNRATAQELFRLVNLIAETMISTPKHIHELYETLPPEKRAAIDKRDGRSPPPGDNVTD